MNEDKDLEDIVELYRKNEWVRVNSVHRDSIKLRHLPTGKTVVFLKNDDCLQPLKDALKVENSKIIELKSLRERLRRSEVLIEDLRYMVDSKNERLEKASNTHCRYKQKTRKHVANMYEELTDLKKKYSTAMMWNRQRAKTIHELSHNAKTPVPREVSFRDYQRQAADLALPTLDLVQCALGLAGECGEVVEVVKKYRRGDFDEAELQSRLFNEIGDVLFYLANLTGKINCSISSLASSNISRLRSRKERGVLKGDGSNR